MACLALLWHMHCVGDRYEPPAPGGSIRKTKSFRRRNMEKRL